MRIAPGSALVRTARGLGISFGDSGETGPPIAAHECILFLGELLDLGEDVALRTQPA
jgi:hypothetical protein